MTLKEYFRHDRERMESLLPQEKYESRRPNKAGLLAIIGGTALAIAGIIYYVATGKRED